MGHEADAPQSNLKDDTVDKRKGRAVNGKVSDDIRSSLATKEQPRPRRGVKRKRSAGLYSMHAPIVPEFGG